MLSELPGPHPRPVVGTLYAVDGDRPLQSNVELADRYGEIFRHVMPGRRLVGFVSSHRLVDEVCDESRFDKQVHAPLQEIRAFAGKGLFTVRTQEEEWGRAHRILMPAFSPVALRGMVEQMSDVAEQLVLKWERMGPDAEIDVVNDFTRLTLDTIALCAFSHRFNSFYSESMHPFVDAMVDALVEAGARGRRPSVLTRLLLHDQARYDEDIATMNRVADELIEHRRGNPLPDGESDILDVMLSARDPQTGEGLSDENIRHQMITFLIAGHETTSGLLSFAVHALLRNPQVLATARDQVDEVLQGRFPGLEDLSRLGYLDQVLRETLRLWPTAPAFSVYPYESTTIGDGVQVDPDETLIVLTPALHRDPAVWDEPERFDPERFSPERAAQIPQHAWKPFGNGQRSCIGRGFALQEAQLVLALVLQRFDLELADPDYRLQVKETLTIKPDGLQVRARVREGGYRGRDGASSSGASGTAAAPAAQPAPQAEPNGCRAQVLFGSEAGTSASFAQELGSQATRQGWSAQVAPLDEATGELDRDGLLLVVTSSYEGQPPANARSFVPWLEQLEPGSLEGLRYAVFGCGNTDWARTYQRIPTTVDDALAAAGATRVVPRGEGDARGDLFGAFQGWYEQLWPEAARAFDVPAAPSLDEGGRLAVTVEEPVREPLLRSAELDLGTVVRNDELVDLSRPRARSKRHLEIALPPGQTYRPGDYLMVMPVNPGAQVARALRRFGLSADDRLTLAVPDGVTSQLPVGQQVAAAELFGAYLELSRPAGRRQVQALAALASDPQERAALEQLSEDDAYDREVGEARRSVLDLLEEHPSVELPLEQYLTMLTPLSPRQYSISSSPRWNPEHVTLTVAHLDAPALSGHGQYRGVASNFLAESGPGTRLPVTVRPSAVAFHPPQDVTEPVVMICAGTGLAPFRGFLQDRALQAQQEGATPGEALLFFGCDAPQTDLLYADRLREWQEQGVVDLRPAFSAEPEDGPEGPMPFVQDRLWADRADVARLVQAGATVFVCGDGRRMAPAVHDTCARIYAEATGASEQDAQAWMTAMEREHGRYVSDVFA